ncbi:MAG: hypothetical protein JW811_01455 [Clostridiales bacterium]|nr:hypothetical protein [Clostridiales bacterium]
MRFHSILFPSAAQQAKAGNCPWLSFRARRIGAEERYITRGNKTFPAGKNHLTNTQQTPAFFADTGLASILDEVLAGREKNPLRNVYYALSIDADTVYYRQNVMRALEQEKLYALFLPFCRAVEGALCTMADGRKAHTPAQADAYAVNGALAYCDAVRELLKDAGELDIPSDGLCAFVDAVRAYAQTSRFTQAETLLRRAQDEIEAMTFTLRIRNGMVLVAPGRQDGDFIRDTRGDLIRVEDCAETPPRDIRLFSELALNPLGMRIADVLQTRYPGAFALLHKAAGATDGIPEPFIRIFAQEIYFYDSFLSTVSALRARGLPFAYPALSGGAVRLSGAYDMDLALRQDKIVRNDCSLSADERGIIVTGANHSGKTTYIRAVGQITALAALGLPVPCEYAELPLFTGFFSHFSDAEEGAAQQGRLKEELLQLKPILKQAGTGGLVLLNEMFSSTTAQDAQVLATQVIGGLIGGGARVLCVTHNIGHVPGRMVSMAAQVVPGSHKRLYTVVRAPVEIHAHVDALIEKHGLTYGNIRERIGHDV